MLISHWTTLNLAGWRLTSQFGVRRTGLPTEANPIESITERSHAMATTILFAVSLVGAGCSLDHTSDAMGWTLSDGTPIGELARTDPIVAVVVDPSQCLRCFSVLAEWLEWERRSGVSVELLLAREPADDEERILRATGMRTDGYLTGVRIEAQRTPIELVLDTGGVIFRAERVYGPSSRLLDALKDARSLREAVDTLSDTGT